MNEYGDKSFEKSPWGSISTSTTSDLVNSTRFDMDKELATISSSCLTPQEHEQLSGSLFRHGYARLFNQHLISEAEVIIGLTEMRTVFGFSPPGPWKKYKRRPPTEDQLAAASTIEEYYDLKEPSSEDRSLDSEFFFEKNFIPVIPFLDKRFPAIRNVYKRRFEEIMRDDINGKIDRKGVDHFISEFIQNILPKVFRATDAMYRRNNECRRLSEMLEAGIKIDHKSLDFEPPL